MKLKVLAINIFFLLLIGLATAYLVAAINKIKPNSETLYGYQVDLVKDGDRAKTYALQK